MKPHFRLVYDYYHYYVNITSRVISIIRYRYKGEAIIYIIRNTVTGMLYVGSSTNSSLRFYHHFITGDLDNSNARLQAAISADGIEKFNLYIMELVQFPAGTDYHNRRHYLRKVEQQYMNTFPQDQLYNEMKSSAS
jgi:group I intron endonuclease